MVMRPVRIIKGRTDSGNVERRGGPMSNAAAQYMLARSKTSATGRIPPNLVEYQGACFD